MPQASSQGIEAALSFIIAKVESLTGEMNGLKQQKARKVQAQSSGDKPRSRDQASIPRPNRDSRSQKHGSSKSRASRSDESESESDANPSSDFPVHRVRKAQVGEEAVGVEDSASDSASSAQVTSSISIGSLPIS